MPDAPSVFVTGASGFVAHHCIQQLLQYGYKVRRTLCSLGREAGLRKSLGGVRAVSSSSKPTRGVTRAGTGQPKAVPTCSTWPRPSPRRRKRTDRPRPRGHPAGAKDGQEHWGEADSADLLYRGSYLEAQRVFGERDWSNLEGRIQPYPKSKTLAERAAWAYEMGSPHPRFWGWYTGNGAMTRR